MNAKRYHAAIMLSTQAAMQSGQVSLPEVIGILEIAKLNAERQAYERNRDQKAIVRPPTIVPPTGLGDQAQG